MISKQHFNGISARRLERFKKVISQRQAGLALVLEDIHDPHNAAAILRTCEGLGIQDIYFIFDQEKRYNPRRVGKVTSSSANKWLSFHIYTSTKECFAELKKQKYQICATILNKNAEDASQAALTAKKIALVVGNEHRGVSETAQKLADRLLYLPMAGFVESFNVSVSAALFLYEIIRQRRTSPQRATKNILTYRLNTANQKNLLADFKKR